MHGVQEVVEVLNLGDRTQSAHGQSDALTGDGGLADSGVADAHGSEFGLHPLETLVDVADVAHVFAKNHRFGVAREQCFEVVAKYDASVHLRGVGRKLGGHDGHSEGSAAVQLAGVVVGGLLELGFDPERSP